MFKFVQRKTITNMKNFSSALFMVLIVIGFNKSGAQNSCLDPTFGIAGISIHSFGSDSITAKSINIQNDGKLIVAGYIKDSINTDFIFLRFHSNGNIDSSFGTSGIVRTDYASGSIDKAFKLIIQTDGKFLLAGTTENLGIKQLLVIRYNSNGLIDNSFGTNGAILLGNNLIFEDMAIFLNGNIILGGSNTTSTWPSITTNFIYQINSNGLIDNTFGTNGSITFTNNYPNFGNVFRVKKLRIQPDQKILGLSEESSEVIGWKKFMVLRFNSNGTLDSTFNNVGYAKTHGEPMIYSRELLIQDDGKIIIQGSAGDNADLGLYASRLQSNGAIDSTFGLNGIAQYYPRIGNNFQKCNTIFGQSGQIIHVGDTYQFWSGNNNQNFALMITNADGSINLTSCDSGFIETNINNNNQDQSIDAILQNDGKVVQLGTSGNNNLTLIRYLDLFFTGIENLDNSQKHTFRIYPNPANETLVIENGIGLLENRDLSGIIVNKLVIKNETENINISELASGYYLLIIYGKNSTITSKLVKN